MSESSDLDSSDAGDVRYRCTQCGNLTRFDVIATRRTKAFHHYTVGGDLAIEDEVVLSEEREEISCRWCGSGAAVEAIGADASSNPPGAASA